MSAIQRPLAGLFVNLSVSESDDSTQLGFPPWQVNRATLQLVAALFGQGVGVVFGHDWREDGVMEAVHEFARQMQPPDPLSEEEARAAGQPLLRNLLPWPDAPRLSQADRERLASTLHIEEAGLPGELRPFEQDARHSHPTTALFGYVRARALTHLRHGLNELCHARLCLGGRRSGSQGRYPGVIEEALFAIQGAKPLYLVGLLGGATQQVIDAVEAKPTPPDFCLRSTARPFLEAPPPPIVERALATRADREFAPQQVWSTFERAGLSGLSQVNRLTPEENTELFHTPALSRAIHLILIALSRLRAQQIG